MPPRTAAPLYLPPIGGGAVTVPDAGASPPARATGPVPPGPKEDGHGCFTTTVPVGIDLVVYPPDTAPLGLRVHGVPMRARVEPGEIVELTLTGQVAVTGVVHLDASNRLAPTWMTARGGTFAEGILTSKGERALDVLGTTGAIAEVAFDFLGSEHVTGARVACSDLALGQARANGESTVLSSGAKALFARGKTVRVCTDASAAHCVALSKGIPLEEISRSGDLVKVRARASEGELEGYARAADLTPGTVPATLGTTGVGTGCGCSSTFSSRRSPDPREVHGPARLAAGTIVYATKELTGPWATVREELEVGVDMAAEADVASLRALPGISTTPACDCIGLRDHAFVARTSVLPP